ncbi:MAG: phage major capsid protein, partial [Clostridium sp.]|nr:phage major capsid protein [Clostridium sp.]
KDAFKDDDGRTVPLVWQHNHEDPTRVIGHALLENRPDGVYAYCSFNSTDIAQHVKELVRHEDVNSLSIYANKLKQSGGDVLHGTIREVSVVLAGANPGAQIEFPIMEHGEESETEACIWPGEEHLEFGGGLKVSHSEEDAEKEEKPKEAEAPKEEKADENETVQDVLNTLNEEQMKVVEFLIGKALEGDEAEHSDDEEEGLYHADEDEDEGDDKNDKTVADVINTLTPKQKKVVEYLIAQAIESRENEPEDEGEEEASHSIEDEEEFTMKKNVFDNTQENEQSNDTLTHAQLMTIASDAKKLGSMRDAVLAHTQDYGIEQIDYLMPEYREVTGGAPQFVKRDDTWVAKIMRGVHHTPFAKVKMTFADITKDQARARGYIKGHRKSEEVFKLLKREIAPTTVYKKQKIDRDDAIDISEGFDKVAWLKGEMRMMLDEELARAYIIGDGRADDSDDKINEDNIVPVFKDDSLYVIRQVINPEQGQAHGDALIDAVTYGMEEYQGSGNCVALMTRREYSQLRLLKDKMGRRIYNSDSEINSALGVRDILFVPQMGDASTIWHDTKANKYYKPLVIILDLDDYNVGADQGGSVNMFEDFDIDYNQMKYLIETRCSGGLTKPYSAVIVTEETEAPEEEENP